MSDDKQENAHVREHYRNEGKESLENSELINEMLKVQKEISERGESEDYVIEFQETEEDEES